MTTKRAPQSKKISIIYTIGHSTRPINEFLFLLQQVAVDLLVDVRSIPRSRTNPQFNADVLPETLGSAGISYRHLAALGGLRHRKKGAAPSLNSFWQVAAFRTYADYAATDAFRAGLAELRALSRDNCCAIAAPPLHELSEYQCFLAKGGRHHVACCPSNDDWRRLQSNYSLVSFLTAMTPNWCRVGSQADTSLFTIS